MLKEFQLENSTRNSEQNLLIWAHSLIASLSIEIHERKKNTQNFLFNEKKKSNPKHTYNDR